jgi:hypothetical protein
MWVKYTPVFCYVLVSVWSGPVYDMASNDVFEGNHEFENRNLMDQEPKGKRKSQMPRLYTERNNETQG